jgi:MOSC domain-containing protein YiiM
MTAPELVDLGDPCAVCRFDGDHYSDLDLDGTLRNLPVRWEWLLDGRSAETLKTQPPGATSSVSDLAEAATQALADLGAGPQPPDRPSRLGVAHIGGHALHLAGRAVAALNGSPAVRTGTVDGLFVSDGGVPKRAIASAQIGYRGVLGDRQAERKHHGRVWQALCLYSADLIDELATDGHPVAPGRAGENVSIGGLEWSDVRPGAQLRIGEVLAEVTAYATPCAKNAQWFADRDFHRIDHSLYPGWSRVYASVLEDGTVRVGDQVTLEP